MLYPQKKIYAGADTIYIPEEGKYKTMQLKTTTNIRNVEEIFDSFFDKYLDTDLCTLQIRDNLLIVEKEISNEGEDIFIKESLMTCDKNTIKATIPLISQPEPSESESFLNKLRDLGKALYKSPHLKSDELNNYNYELVSIENRIYATKYNNVVKEIKTHCKRINTIVVNGIDISPCIKPSEIKGN